ncbi:MAG: biotin/lipoyl-binding protein [Paludibacteraceae bacterium]|nr:biotin/lipoyl-binding protein [Paludibacteraceae bacterium]
MKEFKFKINGTEYTTSVNEKEGNITEVTVNGKTYQVEMDKPATAPKAAAKAAPAAAPKAAAPKAAAAAAAPAAGGTKVVSPLPGSIIKVLVNEGQAVKKGDVLLQLESMKMANDIAAECDGTVKQIAVTAGQSVMQDDLLVVIG